jgi:hypothetical protein
MRDNDIALDEHQIIDTHTSPFTSSLVTASDFGTDLSRAIEKEPDHVPLLHAALTTRDVGAVIEDEWDQEFRLLDCLLHDEELFAQLFPCLCLTQEG